jgi:hypothetical protein
LVTGNVTARQPNRILVGVRNAGGEVRHDAVRTQLASSSRSWGRYWPIWWRAARPQVPPTSKRPTNTGMSRDLNN